jgi:hypothetical protein
MGWYNVVKFLLSVGQTELTSVLCTENSRFVTHDSIFTSVRSHFTREDIFPSKVNANAAMQTASSHTFPLAPDTPPCTPVSQD